MLICLPVIQFRAPLCRCNREWPTRPKITCCLALYRRSLLTLALAYQSQRPETGKEFVRMNGYEALSYFPLLSVSFEALKVPSFGNTARKYRGLCQEDQCVTATSEMPLWSLKHSAVPQLGSPPSPGKVGRHVLLVAGALEEKTLMN